MLNMDSYKNALVGFRNRLSRLYPTSYDETTYPIMLETNAKPERPRQEPVLGIPAPYLPIGNCLCESWLGTRQETSTGQGRAVYAFLMGGQFGEEPPLINPT